jgi:hypothetical protein
MFNYTQCRHHRNTQSSSRSRTHFFFHSVSLCTCSISFVYTYLHIHSFHWCTRHLIPSIINISSFSLLVRVCCNLYSSRYRPTLHRHEIEYRLTGWCPFDGIHSCLYLSSMNIGRHLNTFLSLDTSRVLILVSFHSSPAKIKFFFFVCVVDLTLSEANRQVMNNPINS